MFQRNRQIMLLGHRVDQVVVDQGQHLWAGLPVLVVLELLVKAITVALELTISR
jgi:hypothetical protein